MELPQTVRNREQAERVNALLARAERYGISATRRQARKALQGRGTLESKILEAQNRNVPR